MIEQQAISYYSLMRRLFPMFIIAFPFFFIVINVVSIMHGVSFGVITLMSQVFFDHVTMAVSDQTGVAIVIWTGIALGAVTIGSQVLNGLHNFLGKTFANKMGGYLNYQIHQKSSRIDPITYESPTYLDDINKSKEGMMNSIMLVFLSMMLFTFYVPYFIFMGFYLFSLKPVLALSLVLIFIPVMITQIIRGRVFAKLEDQSAPIRREFEYLERCIVDRDYFKETRILGAVGFFKDLYQSAITLLGRKVWEAEFRTGLIELGMRMLTLLGYFGVLYLLFVALFAGEISIGAFAAVFASIGLMFDIMEEMIGQQIGSMTKNLGTVRNFVRFLDLPERGGSDRPLRLSEGIDGGISIHNVSFRYPGAKSDSLSDVSLDIKKGETIAIVGENGAGKSTLVKLIMGIYLPSTGSVRYGGMETSAVSMESLYEGISAVFQKYQRYKMSLGGNIRISGMSSIEATSQGMDVSLLTAASAKADLNVTVGTFPDGYDTMLSREFDGVDLSGGQWQRVAIARGFYRVHDLIVLDEPTAAIDPLEETRIYNQFIKLSEGKTSVIVTHRMGSAKIANRIVVMDRGAIVEVGTHEELIQAQGKYADMFNAQAKWYVN